MGIFNVKQLRKYNNTPFVTYTFVAIILVVYAITLLRFGTTEDPEALVTMGALFAPSMVWYGEWWRFLTAAFLHIGLQHLVVNLVSLYFIGIELESILGHRRFATLFLVSAVGGSMMSFALSGGVSAGASTAGYGMFAAFIVLAYLYPESYYLRNRSWSFTTLIIFNLVFSVLYPRVDLWGHIGGLLYGAGITFIIGMSQSKSVLWKKPYRILMAILLVVMSSGLVYYGIEKWRSLF
ncbi:rhomboid family intramembrane serine protease [Aerococcaceae bacterium NML191292]|nr:rhomboid family intramembrane serine protease [Aerococcaceae bacterium NML210727]MCW6655350.1 rhomboid family intramembrane serine protease [Aerococcaceae bacterium NML201296]MCW6660471.1 rhomboid family intramembrane serine protease [Aerococcaceae bacterium NML191292]MCW6662079.1 rhomboid family intramembrane serine protease [Aerococcaceae bacterium NML201209]